MEEVPKIAVIAGSYILISLGAFAIFGLVLALAWALPFTESTSYKLITSLISVGLALFAGGYLTGKLMNSNNPSRHATQWGLMVGFVAFGYIFGIDWKWLAALLISGTLATMGGWLSKK